MMEYIKMLLDKFVAKTMKCMNLHFICIGPDEGAESLLHFGCGIFRKGESKNFGIEDEIRLSADLDNKVPDAAMSLAITQKYLETHGLAAKIIVGSIRSVEQMKKRFHWALILLQFLLN